MGHQKEIVLYAHYHVLDYFSTECTYSTGAFRGGVRNYIKQLEVAHPPSIIGVIRSAQQMRFALTPEATKAALVRPCGRCSYPSSQPMCRACTMLESLWDKKPIAALRGKGSTLSHPSESRSQCHCMQKGTGQPLPVSSCLGGNLDNASVAEEDHVQSTLSCGAQGLPPASPFDAVPCVVQLCQDTHNNGAQEQDTSTVPRGHLPLSYD